MGSIITILLVCLPPKLINLTHEPWNAHDARMALEAKIGCERKYPKSPCLSKFIKVEPQMYRALCGGKK